MQTLMKTSDQQPQRSLSQMKLKNLIYPRMITLTLIRKRETWYGSRTGRRRNLEVFSQWVSRLRVPGHPRTGVWQYCCYKESSKSKGLWGRNYHWFIGFYYIKYENIEMHYHPLKLTNDRCYYRRGLIQRGCRSQQMQEISKLFFQDYRCLPVVGHDNTLDTWVKFQ